MTDPHPVTVCEAVIERIAPIPLLLDWHWFLSEPPRPKLHPLPYGLVETVPTKGADYVQVDGTWAKWFLQIILYADASDHEGSLRFMSPLLGTKGPILKALKDTMCDYDDALTRLSNGFVLPTVLSGLKIVSKNKTRLRTATIAVAVGTN